MTRYNIEYHENSNCYRIMEDGLPKMFRGISLTGTEQNDGSWLWANDIDPKDVDTILNNFIKYFVDNWKVNIVRIPICLNIYYTKKILNNGLDYPTWIDKFVKASKQYGCVVIIDAHVWGNAPWDK